MNRPLFRDEALQAQQGPWLGRVIVLRPVSVPLITGGVLLVLLAAAAFLSLAHYTRKITVDGTLVPDRGLLRVLPAESASVIERKVTEGQSVKAGDVLYVLAADRSQPGQDPAASDAARRQLVRAPQDGVLAALLADPGQAVSPAAPVATLVPQGAVLQAQMQAPGKALGFVQPGQAVRLRLEAFPYQKFGQLEGRVLQVSRTPMATPDRAPGAAGEALFRITVALDDAALRAWPQPLAAGLRLQADVLLERRRLIEWLFEPLFGLQHRL